MLLMLEESTVIAAKTDNSEYNKSYYNSNDNSSIRSFLNGITTILV